MIVPSKSKRSSTLTLSFTILLACFSRSSLAFSISPSTLTTNHIRTTHAIKETLTYSGSSSSSSSSSSSYKNQLHSSRMEDDSNGAAPQVPQTFREAEILGLQLMQEGQHEDALKVFQQGLKLPGSRKDIIRTKTLSGPSPVGGSAGGTEGKEVLTLDEFEMQAAHYNIACAFARLNLISQACKSLEMAFKVGFDNYATVRADPDLSPVHNTPEFEALMERFDPKKGFPNPFALFN